MQKGIAILGSTGSIGTQALEVIKANPDNFRLEVLTAQHNADLLIEQAKQFEPNAIVIANEEKYDYVSTALKDLPIKVYTGIRALEDIVSMEGIDIVLTALVGFSGLVPTINAIKAKRQIALANKETMVVAGKIITELAIENKVLISPVDSEHSAIFQCLAGENGKSIEKIILTASGGPFRTFSRDQLSRAKSKDALVHPTWNMGNKVTIDSASLMNKGLEAIEAKWFFNLAPEQIEVIIHPQSIIHSLVQFIDGSIKSQMGLPDMKLPILYALSYPNRLFSDFKRFSFTDYPELTFEKPDIEKFRNLALAYEAMKKCGNMPCIMNAANESAVNAYMKDEISFLAMSDIIEKAMLQIDYIKDPSLEDLIKTDNETRKFVQNLI